jgi:hypothetical protein
MATQTLTENAIKIEPLKWISLDEAAKLEKFVGKSYIPKDDEKFSKRYYYRVESIIPYTPADCGASADQSRYKFLIQKYDRKRTEKVSIASDKGDAQDLERNVRVESHELNNGNWICLDPQANKLIDTDEFKKNFKLDDVVD